MGKERQISTLVRIFRLVLGPPIEKGLILFEERVNICEGYKFPKFQWVNLKTHSNEVVVVEYLYFTYEFKATQLPTPRPRDENRIRTHISMYISTGYVEECQSVCYLKKGYKIS